MLITINIEGNLEMVKKMDKGNIYIVMELHM